MKQSRFCWQSPPKREKKGVGLLVCYCFNPPPKKKKKNGLVYIRCNTWCYHLMCIWKCWQLKTVFLHPTSRLEVFHGLVLFCFSFFHKAKKAKNEQKKMKYVEKKVGDNSIDVTQYHPLVKIIKKIDIHGKSSSTHIITSVNVAHFRILSHSTAFFRQKKSDLAPWLPPKIGR